MSINNYEDGLAVLNDRVLDIAAPRHPDYDCSIDDWCKFRLTAKGGRDFVRRYLIKFSTRETNFDFTLRQRISYCSAHAKAALLEIKNALYKNFFEISRSGGPRSYQRAIKLGVTRDGQTMNNFIGTKILWELVSMGKVGVYVDREPMPQNASRLDQAVNPIYLYAYTAENIINWRYNERRELVSVLLRDSNDKVNEETGLVDGFEVTYRLIQIKNGQVQVQFYDEKFEPKNSITLNLERIPFVIFELEYSLLKDVADHQIALTNLASADINYAIKSNTPFYIEQYDPSELSEQKLAAATPVDETGQPIAGAKGWLKNKNKTFDIGSQKGRRYPKGLEAPSFIHPSPEPLRASMEKQEQIQTEIRVLMDLALTNLAANRTSAESKREDKTSKEEGLYYIGLVLEAGEKTIGEIWADYEGISIDEAPTISYPIDYSLSSPDDRRFEAKELTDLATRIPSLTFQKIVAKRVAKLLVSQKASQDELEKIERDIDDAEIINTDPETLRLDVQSGLVGKEFASNVRGYPEGEVRKAKKDKAEDAAAVAAAQSKVGRNAIKNPAARGLDEFTVDENLEKELDQQEAGKD